MREHARGTLFVVVLVLYAILTLGIIFKSPLLHLDTELANLQMRRRFPYLRRPILDYVMFGQRGPATLAFLPVFLWLAWRRRSTAPIVALVTALVLLNLSVGVVKEITGRLGPRAHHAFAHDIFAGGNIYPSGHVSNAVVLYGVIAMLVVRYRKTVIAAAVFLSVTVGLGTVFLDTHWFSDVVGGWIAGLLVLIALPWVTPTTQRWADVLEAKLRAWWRARRARTAAVGVHRAGAPRETAFPRGGAAFESQAHAKAAPVRSSAGSKG